MGLFAVLTSAIAVYITATYNLPAKLTFGDGVYLLGEALVKSIQENGLKGAFFCSRLGAPEGSALIDTPFLDWIYVLEAWVLSHFIKTPAKILVAMYLASFVFAAITMYILLKFLKCSNSISFTGSLLFSFAPYHMYRGIGHLTLSIYFMVPLAVLLAIYIVSREFNEDILWFYCNIIGLYKYIFCSFWIDCDSGCNTY